MSNSLQLWTAAHQVSLSITNSWSLLKVKSIESVMLSNHPAIRPVLSASPPSFSLPSTRVFSNESLLHIRWPKYWSSASTSVLPMNTQDWFALGWTGWISLQSQGLSRVFSNTTLQKHQFLGHSVFFIYSPTLTSIHDYWKNHSFDYMDLCWQSNVCAF